MSYEKQYYEYDGFWNNKEALCQSNAEKIAITFDYIRKANPSNILDAACGSGVFTNELVRHFPSIDVLAFDRSETALGYVNAKKFVGDINQIPLEDNSFDCVVAHDVIEHLPVRVYEQTLKELARVARRNIIIGTPFNEKLLDRSTQCPQCKSIFNFDLHMRSFSQKTMEQLFSSEGFVCRETRTCDTINKYYGQGLYGRILYPSINKDFKSPICPICGFERDALPAEVSRKREKLAVKQNGWKAFVKSIPKTIWPKYSYKYEIVALFEKVN